jgi:multidrug efflux pump subunit AcrA (membrane-fusion protein)
MLVQVTFLAPPRSSTQAGTPATRILVPQQLIQNVTGETILWVANLAQDTAERRQVTVGSVVADGLVEVTTGLNVGDRVIVQSRESLANGDRIRVTGFD